MTEQMTPDAAISRLEALYAKSVDSLRQAVRDFVDYGTRPAPMACSPIPNYASAGTATGPRTFSPAPMPGCRSRAPMPRPLPAPTCSAAI